MKYLLGAVADLFQRAHIHYKVKKNSNAVHNEGSVLGADCRLVHPEHIYIGRNSYINGGDIFASPNGKIFVGNDCLISYGVHIRTDFHYYEDRDVIIRNQGHGEKDIFIGNDVWIGYGAQIMAGVTIADGSVIGAGAVVTKDTEAYGVYVGVPARCIKYREGNGDR